MAFFPVFREGRGQSDAWWWSFPPPAGVGLMAVTSTSFPVGSVPDLHPRVHLSELLALYFTVELQIVFRDPVLGSHVLNGQHFRFLSDFDIRFYSPSPLLVSLYLHAVSGIRSISAPFFRLIACLC